MEGRSRALRPELDAIVREALAPVSAGLAAVIAYAAFTERHLAGGPDAVVLWADVAVASLYVALAALLWLRPPPARLAHPVAFLIAAAATTTALVTVAAYERTGPALDLALILLGSGLVFLSLGWLLAVVAFLWVGWALVGFLALPSVGSGSPFILEVATVVAVATQWARLRAYQRLIAAEQREAAGRRRAEELAGELGRFASVVAHDLQNPLTAIRIKCATLRRSVGAEAGSTVEALDRVADNMGRMVRDLLEYARAGSRPDLRGDVPLGEVVDEVAAVFAERFEEVQARLDHGDLPTVRGDRTLLGQLVLNLVGNAFHYRRQDRALVVTVHGVRVQGGVMVTVTDNGIGFEGNMAERLFQPFQRGASGRDGHGLGLATCRRIVEAHGGTIHAASQPGGGAVFTVWLPDQAPQAVPAAQPPRVVAAS